VRSRVFLGGQAGSMLGDGLAILAIPLLVLRLKAGKTAEPVRSRPMAREATSERIAGRSGHCGAAGAAAPAGESAPRDPPAAPRSTLLTSRSRRGCSVMACWHRSWQLTHPPAAARRRRTDRNMVNATAAATAATATATAIATKSAAESRKCPADLPNTRNTTSSSAAILLAGRA
jgi:hypothetical protein